MVNKVFIHTLADTIEQQEQTSIRDAEGFCMADFHHHCGTPACVAGWAISIGEDNPNVVDAMRTHYWDFSYTALANKHMQLDPADADELFINYKYSDKKRIVKTLRHLADTGELVWFEEENEHE